MVRFSVLAVLSGLATAAFGASAPVLSSPSAAPAAFAYRGGMATFSVAIQDTSAGGVTGATATVRYPDGTTNTAALSLVSGNANAGTWQGQYTLPTNFGAASQTYSVWYSATDSAGSSGQTPPVAITVGAAGPGDPAIQLTSVPAFGSSAPLSGRVTNASPTSYQIAILAFIEGLGWFSKPYCVPLFTSINSDLTWSASVTTGGVDPTAGSLVVYLVPAGTPYSCVSAGGGLPASLEAAAVAKATVTRTDPNQSVLQFGGMSWWVKSNTVPLGPGPTNFSSVVNNPFVDGSGRLHLKLIPSGGQWYGAEVVSTATLGSGTYSFTLATDETGLDPNVVFGFFTWNNDPLYAHRELDVEFGQLGANDRNTTQFVTQPFGTPGNLLRFAVPAGTVPSTYGFEWYASAVNYAAAQGTSLFPANATSVIRQWTNPQSVPQPGGANARMNVWLYNGASAPANGQPVEVIVSSFQFTPLTVTADSVTPSSGSGGSGTFTLTATDSAGAGDAAGAELLFTPSAAPPSGAGLSPNSCLVYWSAAGNQFYLGNDAGNGWLGPAAAGGSGTPSNSQCSVNAQGASVTTSGNRLTATVPVTFAASYAGSLNVFGYASGATVSSGWQALGAWTVPKAAPRAQTISFGAIANVTLGTPPFGLKATASSQLPVTFASNTPSVCTVSGSVATLVAAGLCSITANQTGNANYVAAKPVTQSFTVVAAQGPPSLSFCGAPTTLPANLGLGNYSPEVCFQYSGLAAQVYTLSVWLLETQTGAYYCASTQWCQTTFTIDNRSGNNSAGQLIEIRDMDVYSYSGFLWQAQMNGLQAQLAASASGHRPPTVNPIAALSAVAGQSVAFTATGSDPNGYSLSFQAQGLPPGASLNSATGAFNWPSAVAGSYQVVVSAVENTGSPLSDSELVTINVSAAPVANTQTISHFPDGGGWKSILILTNNDTVAAAYAVTWRTDTGVVWTPTLVSGAASGTIPVGGSTIIETADAAAVVTEGWAAVTSPQSLGGTAVFRYEPWGQEAAVPLLPSGGTRLEIPFQTGSALSPGIALGIALANASPTQPAHITETIRDQAGNVLSSRSLTLGPLSHTAFNPTLPGGVGVVGGVVEYDSDTAIYGLGIRSAPEGAGLAFTSVDAVLPQAAAVRTVSHVADGGGWRTTMLLVNTDSVPATYTVTLWSDSGVPYAPPLAAGSLSGTIPVGGTAIMETADAAAVVTEGWAEVTSGQSVGGTAIFRYDPWLQEASVPLQAGGGVGLTIPYQLGGGLSLGVALANPSATQTANITETVRDGGGNVVSSRALTLGPLSHVAFNPALPGGSAGGGVVEYDSNVGIYGLGIRSAPEGSGLAFTSVRASYR